MLRPDIAAGLSCARCCPDAISEALDRGSTSAVPTPSVRSRRLPWSDDVAADDRHGVRVVRWTLRDAPARHPAPKRAVDLRVVRGRGADVPQPRERYDAVTVPRGVRRCPTRPDSRAIASAGAARASSRTTRRRVASSHLDAVFADIVRRHCGGRERSAEPLARTRTELRVGCDPSPRPQPSLAFRPSDCCRGRAQLRTGRILAVAERSDLLLALRGDGGGSGGGGLGVEVARRRGRAEVVIQFVDERDAGRDVEFRDLVVGDVVEVLHERAQ